MTRGQAALVEQLVVPLGKARIAREGLERVDGALEEPAVDEVRTYFGLRTISKADKAHLLLALDQRNRVLYVTTHGFGAWKFRLSGSRHD